MKAKIFFFIIFLSFFKNLNCHQDFYKILKKAHLEERAGFKIVYLKGDSFEMGYQQGVLLRKEINQLYRDYFLNTFLKKQIKSKLKRFILWNYFKFKAFLYQRYIPKELRKEMMGIAKGSGLGYSKILMMHTFLDTLSFLRKKKTCTNIVLMPKITKEALLFHGRDLGFVPPQGLVENQVIFFFMPKKGIPFVSIGWPGMCGVLSAMNAKGISVSETGVGTSELNRTGIPIMFLLRELIQNSESLEEAIGKVISSKRIAGFTVTICEKNKKAALIEFTGKRYQIFFPKDNYLVSVNHYLSKELFKTMKKVYPNTKLENTSSYKRLKKFKEFIKSKDKFSLKDIFKILRTKPFYSNHLLQSIVFVPSKKEFFIYSVKEKEYVRFSLKSVFKDYKEKVYKKISLKRSEKISPKLIKELQTPFYKKLIYFYIPKIKNRLPDKSIYIYCYLPLEAKEKIPFLVFIPHSRGVSKNVEGELGKFLAQNGIGFLTFQTGFQKDYRKYKKIRRKKDIIFLIYLDLIKELLFEAQNILDWLKEKEFTAKITLGGVSLGSIVSERVLELREDIDSGIFILGGADLKELLLKSAISKKYKVKKELAPEILNELKVLDPLNFAYKLKDKKILMINAIFDRYIPRKCVLEFQRALNCKKSYWLLSGHLSSIVFLGFIEEKILNFLKDTKKTSRLRMTAYNKLNLSYHFENIKLIAGGKYSEYEKKIRLGFEKKEIFNSPLFCGIVFKGRWEKDKRYSLKTNFSLDFYLGAQILKFTKLKIGFSFNEYSINKVSFKAPLSLKKYQPRPQINFLNLKIIRDTLDNKIYPTKGSCSVINFNLSDSALGSDANFYKIEFENRFYWDLKKERVFVLRNKLGYEDEIGDFQTIPFFEKFFIGGSSSIRGYKGRRADLLDKDNLPLGGRFYGILNSEFRFPIYKKWYGALFFDTGFLTNKPKEFKISRLKCGTGLGLRYRTKWGFLRLDLGIKLGPVKEGKRERFHLSFGLPF